MTSFYEAKKARVTATSKVEPVHMATIQGEEKKRQDSNAKNEDSF
jgi:hypothetical protein